MTKAEFNNNMNKIYEAIRKTYGYSDEADELVDFIIDATDAAADEVVDTIINAMV